MHLETLCNGMNATTKASLGLTSLGLRQYITTELSIIYKKEKKSQEKRG
jgi:hypothetical protein